MNPDQPTSSHQTRTKRKRQIRLLPIILIVLIIGLAGVATYFFLQYNAIKNNPELVTEQETKDLTTRVGKLIVLPSDETPTIATVEDKTKLTNQAFFSAAENGDKLLIYTKAQKAIIYRPSTNQIINVGPLSIEQADDAKTN
jgi:cytoskeletal protein RodZ